DAGQRLFGARRQARDRQVEVLGRARDADGRRGIEAEDVEHVLALRRQQQFLEARGVLEPLFEVTRILAIAILGRDLTVEPGALLRIVEELAQALADAGTGRTFRNWVRDHRKVREGKCALPLLIVSTGIALIRLSVSHLLQSRRRIHPWREAPAGDEPCLAMDRATTSRNFRQPRSTWPQ